MECSAEDEGRAWPAAYLPLALSNHTRLFEQVDVQLGPAHPELAIELHLDKLAKAGRVIVAQGARVAKGLEQRVGCKHLLRHRVRRVVRRARDPREIAHHDLHRLRLARSALARNEDGLTALLGAHVLVRGLSDSVHMRRQRAKLGTAVAHEHVLIIQRLTHLPVEWIDSNADLARVRVHVVTHEAVA